MVALVLLPGMDGIGIRHGPFIAALSGACPVLPLAYPPDPKLGYRELERFVLERLPQEAPFVLLGESFSGPLAAMVAAAAPPGLVGLVLSASFVRNPRPATSLLRWLLAAPLPHPPLWAIEWLLFGGSGDPALRAEVKSVMARVPSAVFRARLRQVMDTDASDQLRRTTVPLLYLRATRDWLVPESAARAIATIRPDARIVDIPAPHLLLQTAPDAAARAVAEFLGELGSSS